MKDIEILRQILNTQAKIEKELAEIKIIMSKGFQEVNDRLDMQGRQLAFLEDDTPTREEFTHLENRVNSLEERIVS